jgi:hypothetical protein
MGKQRAWRKVQKHQAFRHTITSKPRYVFPYDLYLVVV